MKVKIPTIAPKLAAPKQQQQQPNKIITNDRRSLVYADFSYFWIYSVPEIENKTPSTQKYEIIEITLQNGAEHILLAR